MQKNLRDTPLKSLSQRRKRFELAFKILESERIAVNYQDMLDRIRETGIRISRNRFFMIKNGVKDTANIDLTIFIANECDVTVRFLSRGDIPPSMRFGSLEKHIRSWEILANLPPSMQSGVHRISREAQHLLEK